MKTVISLGQHLLCWTSLVVQMVKNLPANAGGAGLIPGSESSPRVGDGNPLQYSCQENAMDRGAWRATVHGSAKQLDTTERLNHHKGEKQPDVLAEQTQPSRQTAPSIL